MLEDPKILVASAMDSNAYSGVAMNRSLYFLELGEGQKIMVDLFSARSAINHQYDLPFHYLGQFIHASFPYQSSKSNLTVMGKKNGYQYLWKEAEATVADTTVQFSFMNSTTFYTLSSMIQGPANVFFARTGANDPDFNLRHDPVFIIRKNASNTSFVNVLEIHGKYDPVMETSSGGNSVVQQIQLLQDDASITVAQFLWNGKPILICEARHDLSKSTKHQFNNGKVQLEWSGPFAIFFNGKKYLELNNEWL